MTQFPTSMKLSAAPASSSRSRSDFRPFSERAALRPYVEALRIDEKFLASAVKPLLKAQDQQFRARLARGAVHSEALLEASKAFQEQFQQLCMQAILERDRRAVKLADERGTPALEALRTLGALDPPWRRWKPKEEKQVVQQLAANLDETRANREYGLRSRLVRVDVSPDEGEKHHEARRRTSLQG